MSHEPHVALYRKYRPSKFSEVVDQEQIVKSLEGAISSENISHAYLFYGSRGTGKTSLARIFAGAIGTSENDLYEIDAASNRGIDDIRLLREAVNTLPFESKRKVYIVDEVHMLTKEAFNALLKTLEEPPSHVLFILATTELDKVPDTIISRCQTFTFRKPNQSVLRDVVLNVSKKEGFKLESASADLIALLGDGSYRDTLGMLQKVLSSAEGKTVSLEEVETITGAPKGKLVNDFISAVAEKNIEKGLQTIRSASEHHIEMKMYLKLILKKMRFVLLLKNAPLLAREIAGEVSEEDLAFLKALADQKENTISASTLLEMLNVYDLIGRSYIPELPLELALMKIVSPK